MCVNFWTDVSALVELWILSALNIEYLFKKRVIWSTRCWFNESTLQHVAQKSMFYENVAWQPKFFDSPPLPRSNTVWKGVLFFVFFLLVCLFFEQRAMLKRERLRGDWVGIRPPAQPSCQNRAGGAQITPSTYAASETGTLLCTITQHNTSRQCMAAAFMSKMSY